MPRKTSILKTALLLTALFEGMAIFARFGLKLESTRDTSFVQAFTFGFRFHHGYFGIIILLLILLKKNIFGKYTALIAALACALIASDLIHHFLVLWPITGSPQFDIRYP